MKMKEVVFLMKAKRKNENEYNYKSNKYLSRIYPKRPKLITN